MTDATARFGLPCILPGQAQKEMFHNEALARIDAALNACVEGAPASAPPGDPEPGCCWIVGAGAGGVWAGHDHALAAWTDAGWRFVAPVPGMRVWDRLAGLWRYWDGAAWSDGAVPTSAIMIGGVQIVGPRQPAVPSPSNGNTIDSQARAAIDGIIAVLMSHGLTE